MAAIALPMVISGGVPANAASRTWAEEKCARYGKAFHELLDMVGRDGVSAPFIAGNEAFIAAGCSNGADVCPTSAKDFDLANKLTIAAMGFGTASTFLPFVCRARSHSPK
jgi:hypothetical protein